jgi:peptide-methionine (R)-S-oxide reductase
MAMADATGTTGKVELTDKEWQERLSPERYTVLRQKGTEPAWSGELLHVDSDGMFTCGGCGAPLFEAGTKFESGSGWPSFYEAVDQGAVEEHTDRAHGMVRTEITCARCGGHLGHVFPDGPNPTGLRYCMNSLSLDFEPKDEADTGSETGSEAADPV